ncbi:MAG: single-stranded DNA-binding protein [Patescibacteria group bacterium]|nr:single-stranded DNA-binding protein [Patescibacteria group bacterium]MDD4303988.1 single-stranded DNA-binding protein [Patescibacteria group bacterium]MDD4695023.1 single-stranded DNA-binding protein [Patescibacteria group bacterium]
MDLNRATIIGRLTADPESRTTPSGQPVVSFSMATNMTWKDQEGQKQEKTEFHNIVAWRKLAEIITQYLKKGSKIYLEGRLQTRNWEDQNGIKKYRTEIIAENMIMLDNKSGDGASNNFNKAKTETSEDQSQQDDEEEINIEDIPF